MVKTRSRSTALSPQRNYFSRLLRLVRSTCAMSQFSCREILTSRLLRAWWRCTTSLGSEVSRSVSGSKTWCLRESIARFYYFASPKPFCDRQDVSLTVAVHSRSFTLESGVACITTLVKPHVNGAVDRALATVGGFRQPWRRICRTRGSLDRP
jgi:hypothetical protein